MGQANAASTLPVKLRLAKKAKVHLSRFPGVIKLKSKFRSSFIYESKSYHLGVHDTLEAALKARCLFMMHFKVTSGSTDDAVKLAKEKMREELQLDSEAPLDDDSGVSAIELKSFK